MKSFFGRRDARVLIGMPCYGEQVYGAVARALMHAAARHHDLEVVMKSSPLLTPSRNTLWHRAVDLAGAGKITHFVFLDADTAPVEPDWLGDLLREMRNANAAVMGVVVSLKGPGGLVNVAHDVPGDLWEVPRPNLRYADLGNRPQTWTWPDLLIGTGVLAVDLTKAPWAPFIKFHIEDEVQRGIGPTQVASISEDWSLCRQIRKHGAQVFATTKIPVHHYGQTFWAAPKEG